MSEDNQPIDQDAPPQEAGKATTQTSAEEEKNFGWAINALKHGHRLARVGWNGKGQFLILQIPDEHSKMTLPYIYISTVNGYLVPWVASQSDMLATDWDIV